MGKEERRQPMVTLETDRLTLRMLRESDLDAYAEMCADPEIMRYIGDGQPLLRPMAWRNLAMMVGHWSLRGYGLWAAQERSSGTLVGRIGFWSPEGWHGFELGWMLRRSFWGRGYATEGARAALQFAFTQLKQPQVISLIHPENAASIRVAQRLGERLLGPTEVMGKPALIYQITREEWERTSQPSQQTGLATRLVEMTQEQIMSAIVEHAEVKSVDLSNMTVSPTIIEMVPESVARENVLIPIAVENGALQIVMRNPLDFETISKLQFILARDIRLAVAPEEQIVAAINRHYGRS
jgi:RimJ/RimL family protein N-acetyltransferase